MKASSSLLLALLLVCCFSCDSTKYYIVRHAEKTGSGSQDPLAPAGRTRADVLRDTLRNKRIDSVFTSSALRTIQTGEPTATMIGETPKVFSDTNQLINVLKSIRNKRVLVVGHSNTVPAFVRALCGRVIAEIPDSDYDNMYIIHIRKDCNGKRDTTFTHTTYGAPTAP